MNKRKIKKGLNDILKLCPEGMELKDYVFASSENLDYGAKNYKGIELYYLKEIEVNHVYLMPRGNLSLYNK
tara:strand:+ start:1011 stop:1223 length:213 start_codon:yes stop_codon:yes gene_type:complete